MASLMEQLGRALHKLGLDRCSSRAKLVVAAMYGSILPSSGMPKQEGRQHGRRRQSMSMEGVAVFDEMTERFST
jgi:hypothetical protein